MALNQGAFVFFVANGHAYSCATALVANQLRPFQMFKGCSLVVEETAGSLRLPRVCKFRGSEYRRLRAIPLWSVHSAQRCMQRRFKSDAARDTGARLPGMKTCEEVGASREASLSHTSNEERVGAASKSDILNPVYQHFPPIPFIARGRCMPGQRLLPCAKEDTDILAKAKGKYVSPLDVEGGIVVRVISAKEAQNVSSPVLRVVRNRQFGIRKGERTQLALFGGVFVCAFASLGFWQLRRMEEKKQIIAHRRQNLATLPTVIESSPFPWTLEAAALSQDASRSSLHASQKDSCEEDADRTEAAGCTDTSSNCGDAVRVSRKSVKSEGLLAEASEEAVSRAVHAWSYRPVSVRGVLDSSTELLVGPRPGLELGSPGFCVVSPLRCEDGSVILVNKGHLPYELAKLPPFKRQSQQTSLFPRRSPSAEQERDELWTQNLQPAHHASRPYLNPGYSQHLEKLQVSVGCRSEPVDVVTVRGILEPGEFVNSKFKKFMLQNRPQDCSFVTVNPKDLASATPGVPNLTECSLLMINAYSIVYDRDINDLHTNETRNKTNDSSSLSDACSKGLHKTSTRVRNRFASYQQKQKEDYLLFYADEHTHFNYACQWFLMGICTAAMTIYKLVEVSRWRW